MSELKKRKLSVCMIKSDKKNYVLELNGSEQKICEEWLDAAVNISANAAKAFSNSSICCITRCDKQVEVGSYVTPNGSGILVIPTCKFHNSGGVRNRIKVGLCLKDETVFINLEVASNNKIRVEDNEFFYTSTESPIKIVEESEIYDEIEEAERRLVEEEEEEEK